MPPIYTTVFLPRESHDWRSLADYSPWGCKESDKTEWLHLLRNNKSTLILSISPTPKGKVNFMSCPHGNTTKTHLWEWRCPFPHSIRQVVHTVTDLKKSRVGALPVPEVWDPDLTPNHPSFHHLRCEHLEGRHCGQEWRGWLNTTTQGMLTFVSEWHGSCLQLSSVHICHSGVSDSLKPHKLQPYRLPCPSPTPRACSNSCPLRCWCRPTISFSVFPFSSCLQSFPASGSFLISQVFISGGQSIGVSASVSVLPMNIQDWFTLGLTGLTSLQFKGLSRVFSNTTV